MYFRSHKLVMTGNSFLKSFEALERIKSFVTWALIITQQPRIPLPILILFALRKRYCLHASLSPLSAVCFVVQPSQVLKPTSDTRELASNEVRESLSAKPLLRCKKKI